MPPLTCTRRLIPLHQTGRLRVLPDQRARWGMRIRKDRQVMPKRLESRSIDVVCALERLFDFRTSVPLLLTCPTYHERPAPRNYDEPPVGVDGPRLVLDPR